MKQAQFYKKLNKEKLVQCQLCRQFCLIKPDEAGFCNVRKNIDGQLYSLVYGYPAAINVDPIEKKPLFHFFPGSLAYSLGTFGCNLKCANCQNYDLSQAQQVEKMVKKLTYLEPEKIVEEAVSNNCTSIAYTYNEPTIWTEYALDIMALARKNKLKNVWVSNGYMSAQCLEKISPLLDAINVDLKSFSQDFYNDNCQASLKPVLENLKTIYQAGVHLEITTLIIPELSDDLLNFKKIAEFIANELGVEVPWHLSKFSSAISWKLKHLPQTADKIIYQAYDIGKDAGLKYVYVGNIPGDEKESTYCSKCNQLAISRFNYEIERFDNHGSCSKCDTILDIVES